MHFKRNRHGTLVAHRALHMMTLYRVFVDFRARALSDEHQRGYVRLLNARYTNMIEDWTRRVAAKSILNE